GANGGDFAQTSNCGTLVAPAASCTINVTFTPTTSGARAATLSLTDNAMGSPQTVGLTGTGAAAAASFTPTSINFGNQQLNGASAAQAVTLSNTGSAPLTIASIAIAGTNSGDFAQTNNCPTGPSSLAVNGT